VLKQQPGAHYNPDSTSSPVVSDVAVRILFVIAALSGHKMHVIDVEGAFLHGNFTDGETIYMKVPQGFDRHYDMKEYVLKLLKTLYGLIQAALAFWRKLVKAFAKIGFTRSKADPCVFYKWTTNGVVIWAVVVDDCLGVGPEKELITSKLEFQMVFNCDDQGEMKEYISCKVECSDGSIKILQPVLLQSLKDEFEVEASSKIGTPAAPGTVLRLGAQDLTPYQQFTYRSGVGKLIHLTKWSRPDILNAVRELARYMGSCNSDHLEAMRRCMSYLLNTEKRGLVLKPIGVWGGRNHVFIITGRSDSNFAACPDTRRSVVGHTVFVHGADGEQVTEAELAAATSCAQSVLHHYRLLVSLGFAVQLPMILEVDNKGAKDLSNNWSVGGRLRHIDVRQFFLRDLKEDSRIVLKWILTDDNTSDVFTKNLHGPAFEKHAKALVGKDEYMQ
jgi:Reverse transcriptase (RNA-dependent DNA polymerase)